MKTSRHGSSPGWTEPYFGVQHLGDFSLVSRWCTVEDYGTFAELDRHIPGAGLCANKEAFSTAELARRAGEKWMRE